MKRDLAITALSLALLMGASAQAQTYSTTRAAIPSTTFPSGVDSFVASGTSASGDLGSGCSYVRGSSTGPGAVKDASNQYWQLGVDKPLSVACFGAKGDGTADDTAAVNAALSTAPSVYLPCGTFLVSALSIPGAGSQTHRQVKGSGLCTTVRQSSAGSAAPIISVGSGNKNDVGWLLISDMTFSSAAKKTAGGIIYAKGTNQSSYSNLYAADPNLFDGIVLDGVAYDRISNVTIRNVQHDGIAAYDGFDCNGYTPVAKTLAAAAAKGATTFSISDTSGLSVGEYVYLATIPNEGTFGQITSISANSSITVSGGGAPIPLMSGWVLTAGYSCDGTNLTLDQDTLITDAGNNDVSIYGGVGGVNVNSAHLYNAANYGLYLGKDHSTGQSNREVFLNSGTDIDSNFKQGVYAAQNSITRLIGSGQWVNASRSGGAVYVASQLPNSNPAESGAITEFTGGVIGQSAGYGLRWEDTGSLHLVGVNMSYNVSDGTNGGDGLQIATNSGDIVVEGNMLRRNSAAAIRLLTSGTPGLTLTGNSFTANGAGPTVGVSPSTSVCALNRTDGTPSGGTCG